MSLRKRKPSSSVITSEPRKYTKSGKHSRIGSTTSSNRETTTETTTTAVTTIAKKTTSHHHAQLPSDYATTFISSSQLSNKEPPSEKIFKIRRKRCAQLGQQLPTRKNGNSSLLFTKMCFKLPTKKDANASPATTETTNNENDQNNMDDEDEDENNNDKNSKNKNINRVSSKTTAHMAMDASDGASNDHISDRTNDEDCLILDESSRGL